MKRPSFITWEQLRVGGVILVALAILIVAVVRLGAAANLFGSRYQLITFVPNANGLRVGGSVMIAGQLAGTVREIEFLPPDRDTTRNLRLTLEINQELQEQVRADSRAKLRTLGLLGDKVVDISPGTSAYQVLAANDTVPSLPTADYDVVIQQASGAVGDLVQLTADLRTITGGLVRGEGTAGQLLTNRQLYDDLTHTLAETNRLMRRLQNPDGTFGQLLNDPTLYRNLTAVTASMDTLVTQLGSPDGTLGRLMRDDTLYTRVVGVVAATDSLLRTARSGEGLVPRLLTDQQLYDQLNKTLTDLNAMVEDMRQHPEKYFRGVIKIF
ncbi:MAG TPA: MlaD family protein [Gemmatimonadaceae bacterium]|nr:MlaD family protein [Gemmatimonadaceae bacterium]